MTAMSQSARSAVRQVSRLSEDAIRAVLLDEDPTVRFTTRMTREGEENQGIAVSAQMRAIYTNRWFWLLASLCPNNRLWWGGKEADLDKRREGAPSHFPDYLMLFIICLAGVVGIGTIRNAITALRDPDTWRHLVEHMDPCVPEGWTRLSDLPERNLNKKNRGHKPIAVPRTARNEHTRPHQPRQPVVTQIRPRIPAPPTRSMINYWIRRAWRGQDKKGNPLTADNPYYGLRDRVRAEFERLALNQAEHMGILDRTQDFVYARPDRNQFIGFDGTVFTAPRHSATRDQYRTGEGKVVTGSKWGITSSRIDGQKRSRLIYSFAHIHKDIEDSFDSEQEVVRDAIPRLRDISQGGIKGLLIDSVIRGEDITMLQRIWVTVVNWPYAASNPDGGSGNRLNPTRVEKSHLRRVATHINAFGTTCEHYIFAVGGQFIQVVMNAMGDYEPQRLEHLDYQQRANKDGTRREYHIFRIACAHGDDFNERIPLFHTSPTSSDPEFNHGEFARVYPPGSAESKFLYGARNDTESRHTDLKARVKHFPTDVAGQELRLLGASIAMNGLAWQVHLEAHGENNVIQDTA